MVAFVRMLHWRYWCHRHHRYHLYLGNLTEGFVQPPFLGTASIFWKRFQQNPINWVTRCRINSFSNRFMTLKGLTICLSSNCRIQKRQKPRRWRTVSPRRMQRRSLFYECQVVEYLATTIVKKIDYASFNAKYLIYLQNCCILFYNYVFQLRSHFLKFWIFVDILFTLIQRTCLYIMVTIASSQQKAAKITKCNRKTMALQ